MPTSGIRFTVFVWEIKSTKYKINSLNGFPIEVGVTFMFNSIRNGHTIDGKIEEEKMVAMAVRYVKKYVNMRRKTSQLGRSNGPLRLDRPRLGLLAVLVSLAFLFLFLLP
jgi:hypothetical protein